MKYPDKSVSPCDKVLLPVFLTVATADGLICKREMFSDANVCGLRWYEPNGSTCKRRQIIVKSPCKWLDGQNFWDLERGAWKW